MDGDYEALIVSIDLSGDMGLDEEQQKLFDLEDSVIEKVGNSDEMFVDGHEFGDSEFRMYIYAKDIQKVFDNIKPTFEEFPMKPIRYKLRFGSVYDEKAKEIKGRIIRSNPMNSKHVYAELIKSPLINELDIKVSKSTRSLIYKNYEIKIVASKWGYDEMFGFNFFLRGFKTDAAKDEYGNFKDMFDKTNMITLTPRTLYDSMRQMKKIIAAIYNDPPRLSTLGYFAIKTDEELRGLVPILIEYTIKNIDAMRLT